jgi:hypothetical protein
LGCDRDRRFAGTVALNIVSYVTEIAANEPRRARQKYGCDGCRLTPKPEKTRVPRAAQANLFSHLR